MACEAGLLEIAVNAALNPIIIINNFGEVVYWNAAAESTFGYSREEAIGQDVHILIAPKRYHEQVKRGVEIFRECESGEVANKVQELQAVRKNGQEFPIELSLSSIKSSEGRWSVGVVRDITEQRKAKEDLVKKEMFIRRLLNEIDKPIFYENSDGVIVLCNIAFANMVGLSVDDVVGRLLSDIAPACFANFNNAAVFKIIENGEAHSSEMCLETADKGLRDIVLHTSLMCGDSNHEFGIVGIVIDVTEEKKMMLKILDSERTESIGYLAGGIGHDFNNYLMGMAGNAGLMQILHNSPKKPEDRLSENQLKYLKRVLEVSERAGNLVKQLLSLGRKDFVIEPISMNLTVQQAYTVLRTIDKGTEINICSHGDDYISGDSLEIQRLIVNLGVNAIHAMQS
ncbi:PAS domain S-box protein, partial [Candidatus Falkowbacteria bacterium]|nr:PAS domain S-box protein [Candidatus Falkowbacteria bacterium]